MYSATLCERALSRTISSTRLRSKTAQGQGGSPGHSVSSCSATNLATVRAPAPACREMVRAGFCRTCDPAGVDWARKKLVKALAEPLFMFEPFVIIKNKIRNHFRD